jgi:aminobenzoyl-glutamate utilization protein B
VVPDFAEVYYYVRHPNAEVLVGIWERVLNAGEGAALGTGTSMDFEIIHGIHSLLPNDVLSRLMDRNLRIVGGVSYTERELAFARQIYETLGVSEREIGNEAAVEPYRLQLGMGSTDVGDVSWVVPTAGLGAATWVPGTSAHSWQAVAAGGTSIGTKGMLIAAKTLALTAVDLFDAPEVIEEARTELLERRGPDFEYWSLVGDRDPPLDYRK